jgi:hypothetical protein
MWSVGWTGGLILAVASVAMADPVAEPAHEDGSGSANASVPVRRSDATFGQIFHGPFQSSRLFAMPTADTVGAYVLSLSGDGSLLQQPGVLTSAGVVAIGFGDIAQLEYRHAEAISVGGVNAPVPAVGVQVTLPFPEYSGVPVIGVAFHLGVKRTETVGTTAVGETVTSFFFVARERFDGLPWLTLHAGVLVAPTKLELSGDTMFTAKRTLTLPTAGLEIAMNPTAKLVAEIGDAPRFTLTPGEAVPATITNGVLGRLGVRWSVLPWLGLDASFG